MLRQEIPTLVQNKAPHLIQEILSNGTLLSDQAWEKVNNYIKNVKNKNQQKMYVFLKADKNKKNLGKKKFKILLTDNPKEKILKSKRYKLLFSVWVFEDINGAKEPILRCNQKISEEGGEGIIELFQRQTGEFILVKSAKVKTDESQESLKTEAKNLQELSDIYIGKMENDQGEFFIAMQLLPGQDLEKYLDQLSYESLGTQLKLCMQIAKGTAKIHEKKYVFRDLKPSNLIKNGYHITLCDFGSAVPADTLVRVGYGTTELYLPIDKLVWDAEDAEKRFTKEKGLNSDWRTLKKPDGTSMYEAEYNQSIRYYRYTYACDVFAMTLIMARIVKMTTNGELLHRYTEINTLYENDKEQLYISHFKEKGKYSNWLVLKEMETLQNEYDPKRCPDIKIYDAIVKLLYQGTAWNPAERPSAQKIFDTVASLHSNFERSMQVSISKRPKKRPERRESEPSQKGVKLNLNRGKSSRLVSSSHLVIRQSLHPVEYSKAISRSASTTEVRGVRVIKREEPEDKKLYPQREKQGNSMVTPKEKEIRKPLGTSSLGNKTDKDAEKSHVTEGRGNDLSKTVQISRKTSIERKKRRNSTSAGHHKGKVKSNQVITQLIDIKALLLASSEGERPETKPETKPRRKNEIRIIDGIPKQHRNRLFTREEKIVQGLGMTITASSSSTATTATSPSLSLSTIAPIEIEEVIRTTVRSTTVKLT
jgi:serine/threonine protein kinase